MGDELLSPAEKARLVELGTVPCTETHTVNFLGERVDEPHTLAECGGSPMVEKLGGSLPKLDPISAQWVGAVDWAAEREKHGLGDSTAITSMDTIRCDCGAGFTKPTGVERPCTACGTVHK